MIAFTCSRVRPVRRVMGFATDLATRRRIPVRDALPISTAFSEVGANDSAEFEEESSGYKCEGCKTVAKSRGGLLQHERRKNTNSIESVIP